MKKKILMICPFPFVQDRGSPLLVYNLVSALSSLGHKVDLVCVPYGKDPMLKNVNVFTTLKLTRAIPIGLYFMKPFYDFLILLKVLRLRIKNDYDILHGQHIEGALIGLVIKGRKPLYYTVHSLLHEEMKITKKSGASFLRSLFIGIEKLVYRRSKKIFCISPSFADFIGAYTDKDKCLFIPDIYENNAINNKITEKIDAMFSNKLRFMYTGNLSVYQGIEILIESFKEIDGVLLIVGGSHDEVTHYKNMAENLQINNIYFFGQKPFKDQDSYLASADVLISPRLEGSNIPSKLYKYIQAKKPTILTDIPAHTQIAKESFLFCRPGVEDLSHKMKLMCDRKTRMEYQKKISEVSSEFSRNSYINLVEEYY